MVDSVFEMPNWKTLVVDDQQVIRDAVRCLPTQYIGESDECGDGDEAVDKYAQAFESGSPTISFCSIWKCREWTVRKRSRRFGTTKTMPM